MTPVHLRLCAIEELGIPNSDSVILQRATHAYSIGSTVKVQHLKTLYAASIEQPIFETRSYIYKVERLLQTVERYKKPFDIEFKPIDIPTQKSDLNFLIWSTLNFHTAFQQLLFSATSCYHLTHYEEQANNTAFYLYNLIPRIQAVQKKLNHRMEAARVLAPHLYSVIIDIFDGYTE